MPFARLTIAALTLAATVLTVQAGAQTVIDRAARDQLFNVPKGDPDMMAAMKQARTTLPEFFAAKQSPTSAMTGFSVKIAIRHDNGNEFFWIAPFEKTGDKYIGRLNNTPRLVKNLQHGDTVTFNENEIVDWTYRDGDRMKGNFTSCALMKREPRAQAEAFIRKYGMDCKL